MGERNARFAVDFLQRERIALLATDFGGTRARRVYFTPARNKVLVQTVSIDVSAVLGREEIMRRRMQKAPISGGAELF